ncbi:MAG: hypothetical protein ACJ0DE_02950 [Dehalococcoidia bacterium]
MKIIPSFFNIIISKINYSIPDNHVDMVNSRIKGIIEDSKELSKFKINNMDSPPKINHE